ncbi:MAG: methyltransferase domain-containing protein [Clostridia bacterium]|nr:methyltransferase domain-containing protein [Clostridia bacterium]
MKDQEVITGNFYNKYKTKNFIERKLVYNFINSIQNALEDINFTKVLDAGCGEGYITNIISNIRKSEVHGIDIGDDVLAIAQRNYTNILFNKASIYNLPYESNSFDLVVACEVLEHLEKPEEALMELQRVSTDWVLLSVPREPIWSLLNLARGKYIRRYGNTPGHIQRWGKRRFVDLIQEYFEVEKVMSPLPWTIVLCKKG